MRERTRSTGSLCIRARSSLTSSESWTTWTERDTDDAEMSMSMSDVPEWETELSRSHSQHRKTAHKNGIKHVAKILNQVRNSYLLLRSVPRRTKVCSVQVPTIYMGDKLPDGKARLDTLMGKVQRKSSTTFDDEAICNDTI